MAMPGGFLLVVSMMRTYFVVYEVGGVKRNAVVDIDGMTLPRQIPDALRQAVHPDRPGDPSDGMPARRAMGCLLLNFIELAPADVVSHAEQNAASPRQQE